jgi:hypothetical protein
MKQIEVTDEEVKDTLRVLRLFKNSDPALRCSLNHYSKIYPLSMRDRKVRICISVLQERGEEIIAFSVGGYGYMPDDPGPAIEYCNKLYRRVKTEKDKADNIYFMLKRKYGQEVASKVDQPFLDMELEKV